MTAKPRTKPIIGSRSGTTFLPATIVSALPRCSPPRDFSAKTNAAALSKADSSLPNPFASGQVADETPKIIAAGFLPATIPGSQSIGRTLRGDVR